MALGELQSWSWAASGYVSKSFLVCFLYLSNVLFMISWKLVDEEVA